jgi:hypothetical protein
VLCAAQTSQAYKDDSVRLTSDAGLGASSCGTASSPRNFSHEKEDIEDIMLCVNQPKSNVEEKSTNVDICGSGASTSSWISSFSSASATVAKPGL